MNKKNTTQPKTETPKEPLQEILIRRRNLFLKIADYSNKLKEINQREFGKMADELRKECDLEISRTNKMLLETINLVRSGVQYLKAMDYERKIRNIDKTLADADKVLCPLKSKQQKKDAL